MSGQASSRALIGPRNDAVPPKASHETATVPPRTTVSATTKATLRSALVCPFMAGRRAPTAPRDASASAVTPASVPARSIAGLAVLLDDLLRDVAGHVLVMVEDRRERATPVRERPELRRVGEELGLGHVCRDDLVAPVGVHAQDPSPFAVQVP